MNDQVSPGFPMPSKTCRLRSELAHFLFLFFFFFKISGNFNTLYVSLQTNLILSSFSMCNFQSAAFNCICCHHVLGLETGLLDTIIIHTIIKTKRKIGSFGSQLQGCCQITNLLPLQNSNKKSSLEIPALKATKYSSYILRWNPETAKMKICNLHLGRGDENPST